tara:strand:- start:31935 stop:32711 length:777 start_codon:yes stop_codon:yes gene_type:complete
MVKGSSLLIGLFFLASCANKVRVHTPAPLFMTAETKGKSLGGDFLFSISGGTEGSIDLDDDDLDGPLALRNDVAPVYMHLGIGIVEKVDFYLRSSSAESPGALGLKWQFLGKSKQEAQKGDHSLAMFLGGGSSTSSRKSDDIFDGDSDSDFEAEADQKIREIGVIHSYRSGEETVTYSSLRMGMHELNVDITKDTGSPSLAGEEFDTKTTFVNASVGVKRYWGKKTASLELSAQNTKWSNNESTTFAFISGAFGWHWD